MATNTVRQAQSLNEMRDQDKKPRQRKEASAGEEDVHVFYKYPTLF